MRPNLFIVGAAKCGTTAWVEYLGSHPDIYFSPLKEPHFFCSDFHGWQQVKTEEEYLALFDEAKAESVRGEASVWYLRSAAAAAAIHQFNPDAKIIILVRDQDEFLTSLHNHAIFIGDECVTDFDAAWRLSGKRDDSTTSATCREPKLLDYRWTGKFSEQIERYFKEFPEDQIRVFHFRDWSADPRPTYVEIMRFLGIEDDGRTEFPKINAPKHRRTRWIGPLVRNPPKFLQSGARLLKKLTGKKSLGLADWARQIDTVPGSITQPSEDVLNEIRDYFAEDNALLEKRIWRPGRRHSPQLTGR